MILAEVSPCVMVTNYSTPVDFCLSAILTDAGRAIEEEIWSTENVAGVSLTTA